MASNISIYSSTPRTVFRGIKDMGAVNILMPVESVAIRLPLYFNFAPYGSYDEPYYVNGNSVGLTVGQETIMPRSKFFNHQSVFARTTFQAGASAIFKRLRADGANQASLRVSLDVVKDQIPEYSRNPDGSYKRDGNGELITTGVLVDGYFAQWRLDEIPSLSYDAPQLARFGGPDSSGEFDYGIGKRSEGMLVSGNDGEASTLYPIFDVMARWEGGPGNNTGFRLSFPGANGSNPIDPDLAEQLGSAIYRLQVVTRANANSTPQVMPTLMGEDSIDFTFKKDTVDLTTDKEYDLSRIFFDSYESYDREAFTGYGPFEKLHVYNDHLEELLTLLTEAETAVTEEEFESIDTFNLLTGRDVNGIPYRTFIVQGPADGGILMTENTSHFLQGGDDGDVSEEAYNQKVDELLTGLQSSNFPFDDIARMPYDSVWDTGFPVETKLKFKEFHSLRPDVYIHACTQDVSRRLNSPSEDTSIGMTLRSHFRAASESQEFGTKAARFAVFNSAGYFLNDDYRKIVPFLEWVAMKGAEYMGAADGKMRTEKSFGRGEQNVVTRYVRHNAGLKPLGARNVDWNNGVNYPEFYDMNRLFFAALQSTYSDSTSPIRSYMNVQILCNLTRIGNIVWRELAGDDQMDDGVFLDEVNRRVSDKVFEAYDNRANIVPNAYYTPVDTALGTHYHLDIEAFFNNFKTVMLLAVIARRKRDQEVQA